MEFSITSELLLDGFKEVTSSDPYKVAMNLVDLSSQGVRGYSGYLRASQIASVCPREEYLGYKYKLYRHDIVASDPSLKVTFDIGHAVHFFIQNSPQYFGDRRVGWWKCLACGYKWFGRYQRIKCEKCGASPNALVYDELEIKIEQPYRLWGHIDMLIAFDNGIRVLDIKTIDKDSFLELERPHYENVLQLICYMNYVNYLNLPVKVAEDYGIILYVSKGYYKSHFPLKAFLVENDLFHRKTIDQKLKVFTHAIEQNVLPKPLTECLSSGFKHFRAKSCPALEVCKRLHNEA